MIKQDKKRRKKQRQCQYKTSKDIDQLVLIIQGDGTQICSLCYSICQNQQHSNSDLKVEYSSQNTCTCTNHIPYDQCQKMFENLYKNVNSVRSLLALNIFLSLSIDEKGSIISSLWEQSIHNINNDIQLMFDNGNLQKFEWDLYDVAQIDERIGFVKFFNKEIQIEYLLGLDTRNIFKVFPLEYIIKVFEYPERSFGQQIYNNVLNYHTYILNFFITYHIKKDFLILNFIDAQQLKYSSIYQRQELNRLNRLRISSKYFSNDLNIVNFIQVLLENFIPTIHWRWIGANHKVHIYTIYIIKLLFQYLCITEEEAEIVMISLENKINNLKVLEQSIDRDCEVINKHWINIWREGMSQIRLYLIEIILYMTYLKLDNLIISQKNIKFEEYSSIFFESDFSLLSQNMVLNYILSSQKIDGVTLILRETYFLCLDFFNIMYNYEDGYYLNLQPPPPAKKKPPKDQFLKQLIDQYFIIKSKAFNEKQILDDFKDLIKSLQQIESDEIQFQILPELILFIKSFKEFFQKDNESGDLIQKLLQTTYQECGYCLLIQQNKCLDILNLLEIWPLNIIGVLNTLPSQILHNQILYELILGHYSDKINQLFNQQELNINLIDQELITFLIQETLFLHKLVTDQEDYDIIGQRTLIKHFRQIIKPELLFKLLEDYSIGDKRPEYLYVDFSFQFLKLINLISQIRYLSETLEQVKIFTPQNIIQFSQICLLNIEFNMQVTWMVYIFFIDPKENLITNRELYYTKKHNDSLYFEDMFAQNDYSLFLQYFYPQYINKIKSYLDKYSFNHTQQNYIYSGILKLCRHLLRMKFKDIDKFISQINDFEQFLLKISQLEPQQKQNEVLLKLESYQDNPRKILLIIQMIQEIVQSKIAKHLIKDQQQSSFLKIKKKGKQQLNRYNSLHHENGMIRHECIKNQVLDNTLNHHYLKAKQDLNLYNSFFLDPNIQNSSSHTQLIQSNKIYDLFNFFNNIFTTEKDNFVILYNAIKIFCNIFFRDSGTFCEVFANYIDKQKNFELLDNLWLELVRNINIVIYKSIKDKLYNDSFQKTNLLLIFHRSLVKNSSTFRKIFGEQKINNDQIKMVRVERLETLLEKVLDLNSDQDFTFLQKEILHTQYLVILENAINKLKIYSFLSSYKRSILEKTDCSVNQLQINLLKFFNELVYPHIIEINQFISNVIEYNMVEDLLYQRVQNFYDPHLSHKLGNKNYHDLLEKYKNTYIKNQPNEFLECAIQCFIYIKLVTTNYIDKEIKNKNIYYCFLNDILSELEFQNQEGELSKLMIKNDLRNLHITERTKSLILFQMEKSSFYTQLKSLTNMMTYIDYETKYLYITGFAKFISDHYKLFDIICIYLGFTIFILILVDQQQYKQRDEENFIYDSKYKNLMDILGFIIIGICSIFICLHLKFTYKLEIKKSLFFRQLNLKKINVLEWIWIIFFECLIFNGISGSFCWYLGGTASAMYASQQNYFLIIIQCVNLHDGFKETMGDIFQKFKKLVWLSFYVCFIIYAFSYTVWAQYKTESFQLVQNSQDQKVNPCQNSLIECFIYFSNTGYQRGLGELLTYESLNDQQGYVTGFFFIKNITDVLFYLLIQILFIALVVAQVIDGITHGHRERGQIITMLERCLVCNVHRSQFEKLGIDYEEHCNKIHSIWIYLIFMINVYFNYQLISLLMTKVKVMITLNQNFQDKKFYKKILAGFLINTLLTQSKQKKRLNEI